MPRARPLKYNSIVWNLSSGRWFNFQFGTSQFHTRGVVEQQQGAGVWSNQSRPTSLIRKSRVSCELASLRLANKSGQKRARASDRNSSTLRRVHFESETYEWPPRLSQSIMKCVQIEHALEEEAPHLECEFESSEECVSASRNGGPLMGLLRQLVAPWSPCGRRLSIVIVVISSSVWFIHSRRACVENYRRNKRVWNILAEIRRPIRCEAVAAAAASNWQ